MGRKQRAQAAEEKAAQEAQEKMFSALSKNMRETPLRDIGKNIGNWQHILYYYRLDLPRVWLNILLETLLRLYISCTPPYNTILHSLIIDIDPLLEKAASLPATVENPSNIELAFILLNKPQTSAQLLAQNTSPYKHYYLLQNALKTAQHQSLRSGLSTPIRQVLSTFESQEGFSTIVLEDPRIAQTLGEAYLGLYRERLHSSKRTTFYNNAVEWLTYAKTKSNPEIALPLLEQLRGCNHI